MTLLYTSAGQTVFGMEQNWFHSEAQVPVQVVCLTFIVQNFPLRGAKTKKIIVLQEIRVRASKSVSVQATCGERKSTLISMTIMTDNGYTPCGSLWNIQTRKYTYKPF